MPFKIRTKLIVAFMVLISVILILTGLVGYYNFSASDRAVHKVEAIAEEVIVIGDLHRSLEHVLMPANDYLITGDRKYIDDFNVSSKKVEEAFKKTDELLGHLEAFGLPHVEEERKSLKDIKTAWLNIKELSLKILNIPNPIGNKDGAMMMEEMDYRWGGPATELIHKWQKGDVEEYKEAVELAENARRTSWVIMGSAGTLLLILGAGFAVFYSGFFVRPIKKLHNAADAIAGGDFKSRVDVKTGDELEQLSNAMNEMAEKLDDFYGSLENQVMERTKELKESEDKYRSMIESANDMIWTLDSEGIFTFINRQAEEIGGYALEEVMGRYYLTFVHPEERAMREEYFKRTLSGERTQFTVRSFGKDHEERILILRVSSAPIYKEGKVVGTVNFGRDITDLRKAEEKLKESEERYRGIFEKTPNAMVVFDAETLRFENVNRAAVDLYGYTEEEFRFLTPLEVSAEVEKTRKSIQNGLAEKYTNVPVRYHKKKDGTVFPIEIFMGTFLSNGRPKGFAVIVDLTEIKKDEEILMDSEERFRVLGTTAPNAIICLKAPDTITFWNRRAVEIFGYSEEEAFGKSMHDLIVPERYREKAREGQKNFFQTGTGPVVGKKTELFALRRDGTEFPIELSLSAMKIGGNWQATGIVRDITERKQAEEELKRRFDEIKRMNRLMVDREIKMAELKKENQRLRDEAGKKVNG